MGVQVDDTRRQGQPVRIDGLLAFPDILADRGDPSAGYRQLAGRRRIAHAIDQNCALDDQIVHRSSLP